jgi:hypothetical protein
MGWLGSYVAEFDARSVHALELAASPQLDQAIRRKPAVE